MKKISFSLIFLVSVIAVFGQSGSLSQSVYRSRVNDSTSVTTPAGYGLLYYNNQRPDPKWLFSNDQGATWQELGSGSGGTVLTDGNLTTANGSAVDLGGEQTGDITENYNGYSKYGSGDFIRETRIDNDAGGFGYPVMGRAMFGNNDAVISDSVDGTTRLSVMRINADVIEQSVTHKSTGESDVIQATGGDAKLIHTDASSNQTILGVQDGGFAVQVEGSTGSDGDVIKKVGGIWTLAPDGGVGYTSTAPEIISASISGQTMKGRVLTVNYYFIDIDGTAEGTNTYQWIRADDANGTGVANISGATSSTYTLVTGDLTKYIACIVTPVNVTPETGSPYTTDYVGAVDDVYYPADQSNIVISYGLKKMAVAYAGNCIQVQNTNGGTTFNIGFDGNGDIDWAAVATAAGGGNTYLKIWYDQSGNGFNMTFTTFAKQPLVNYTDKRIEWVTTNDAVVTHNTAMDIGTGDFAFFIEATHRSLMDTQFTFFSKETNFAAQNFQLYNFIGTNYTMYTGNGNTNTLTNGFTTPDRRFLVAGYRNSTTKFLNHEGVVKSASETALTLTSTNNLTFNTGDGGPGDWFMWSFSFYKQNNGADFSKYKKFVSPN